MKWLFAIGGGAAVACVLCFCAVAPRILGRSAAVAPAPGPVAPAPTVHKLPPARLVSVEQVRAAVKDGSNPDVLVELERFLIERPGAAGELLAGVRVEDDRELMAFLRRFVATRSDRAVQLLVRAARDLADRSENPQAQRLWLELSMASPQPGVAEPAVPVCD